MKLTEQELRDAIAFLNAHLIAINTQNEGRALDEATQTRFNEGRDMRNRLQAELDGIVARRQDVAGAATDPALVAPGVPAPALPAPARNRPGGGPGLIDRTGDPFDLSDLRWGTPASEIRDRALRAIEAVEGLDERHRENAETLLRRAETPNGGLARHMISTGSDDYRSAFQMLLAGREASLSPEQRQALDVARAMSLTDANGGYAVPFTLDPTIIDTRDGTTNPVRRISTIRTTVTDQWQGVTSSGMTVSWDGEAAEVSDDSPTFGPAPIPVHKAQGFAVGSIEVTQDVSGLESDLREMINNGKDDAEGVAFVTGSGSGQPTGIVTALAASAGGVSIVAPTTAETFAVADLYKMEESLPPRYRLAALDGQVQSNRASWLATRKQYNRSRQFDTQGGAQLWERIGAGLPAQLLGYPTYEASAMDGTFDPAATAAHNYLQILGDFRYYVIVDRVGLAVEYIPHVFGENGRPTGQRGWYCYWRVGADAVNDNAFRMLDIPTTA